MEKKELKWQLYFSGLKFENTLPPQPQSPLPLNEAYFSHVLRYVTCIRPDAYMSPTCMRLTAACDVGS